MSSGWREFLWILSVLLLVFGGGCVLVNLVSLSVVRSGSGVGLLGIPGWLALLAAWLIIWFLRRSGAAPEPDGAGERNFEPSPEAPKSEDDRADK